MSFDFDEIIDRVGTHSSKWDTVESKYGVSPETGIPMWVADMDFAPRLRFNRLWLLPSITAFMVILVMIVTIVRP